MSYRALLERKEVGVLHIIDRAKKEAETREKQLRRRIKAQRLKRGWSQDRLAREAWISKETIRLIEAGKRVPNVATQHMLAAAFKMTWEDLMADDSSGIAERDGDLRLVQEVG